MKARMFLKEVEPRVYKAMLEAEKQVASFDLDPKLAQLIKMRVSQLNGCGYCLNMHGKEARQLGETEQRLYTLSAWWETPFFTEVEQAVLRLAEELTQLTNKGVSDEVYDNVVRLLGEQKLAQLILAIITINSWNRIAIATHMVADQD
ncbi:carboxymuconolactone decarboxylase family protein [Spirosoma sp. KCTC 42546]|uniref:carboxymuconolactone decarboxylase family protein n=1 Tax=Spirosoma sp. KCTC 42546 TaxID=2520506 RepID=UPI001159CC0D|nr:carboxymuconolactone decarboxylase family protein [Spirosoma sp. KCTC 42546]QDK78367.1 carboxymuconolactone decarboxylase family protein [Spirosoma sp. KCTC 42546]